MKIGIFIPNLESSAGGSFTFVNSLIETLASEENEKHELIFLFKASNDPSIKYKEINSHAIPGRFFARGTRALAYLILRFNAIRKMQIFDQDMVAGYLLSKYLKRIEIDFIWSIEPLGFPLTIPYATTHWDLAHRVVPIFPEFSNSGGDWKRREIRNRSVLTRAALICTGTKQGFQEIASAYGVDERNCLIVPMPAPSMKEAVLENRDQSLFIYPAQFWSHKNHITLVKAFDQALKETQAPLRLILTGSDKGNKEIVLDLVSELNLEKSVFLPGFISEQDLIELYKKARMLLFPTHLGPDNIPPLEAMAFGCPVAVSDVFGAREQFGDAAIYFDPHSEDEIKNVILRAAADKDSDDERVNQGIILAASCSPSNYVKTVMNRIDQIERKIWNFS